MRGITKRFPGVVANDDVSLELRAGEVHALVGENGAGKSTLMRILYGMYPHEEGSIEVRGQAVRIHSPRDAIALGIGMVHQHFVLVDPFTVAENVILGQEGGPIVRADEANRKVTELAEAYGFQIDPAAAVESLSVGEEQRVEILKALYRGVDILILDEPTAVLTPTEAEALFENLRRLRDSGKSIVFISHKLDEVLEIADRITVLRRGKVVGRDDAVGDVEGAAGRDDGRPPGAVPAREASDADRRAGAAPRGRARRAAPRAGSRGSRRGDRRRRRRGGQRATRSRRRDHGAAARRVGSDRPGRPST